MMVPKTMLAAIALAAVVQAQSLSVVQPSVTSAQVGPTGTNGGAGGGQQTNGGQTGMGGGGTATQTGAGGGMQSETTGMGGASPTGGHESMTQSPTQEVSSPAGGGAETSPATGGTGGTAATSPGGMGTGASSPASEPTGQSSAAGLSLHSELPQSVLIQAAAFVTLFAASFAVLLA
ncbi:hypothetical protein K492DRAFT_185204 [Lichtheimia hyalospora FSU 10163]|nr:hypothetical protein K492DRAFT_185204 [Lichtheimia hyalospora FSU 10163]